MGEQEGKTMEAWAKVHGSGTLKQAIACDMAWYEQALHERLAMEVASAAMLVPESRLAVGRFKAAADCKVTTELGWYARTLRRRWEQHAEFRTYAYIIDVRYFVLAEEDEPVQEGAGFVIRELHLPWFPKHRVLLIPLAFWDAQKKSWRPHENPL
jgi:hypothetical protein